MHSEPSVVKQPLRFLGGILPASSSSAPVDRKAVALATRE